MSNSIEALKSLIILNESLDDVLIKYGNTYHVVSCYVNDYDVDEQEYTFYIAGYSCSFDIDAIDDWKLVKDCF